MFINRRLIACAALSSLFTSLTVLAQQCAIPHSPCDGIPYLQPNTSWIVNPD
ncbi:MAG: hypothetical protein IT435_07590 [Phycisphaerales bacterium]|nr:hypothetical protein [Phycisphaerales bacterium]